MSIFALTPMNWFWPWFAGVVVLIIGLFSLRKEFAAARGLEKLLALGRVFLAVPMGEFGAQHFTAAVGVSQIVPSWIPFHLFWTYLVGVALVVAALSMATNILSRLAAAGLATMLILFVFLMHIPNLIATHPNLFAPAILLRDLGFAGGAVALASIPTENSPQRVSPVVVTLARIFIAVGAIFFGIAHLVHPEFVPGPDLDHPAPTWIIGHTAWSYLAGVVYMVAGAAILQNRSTKTAATALGCMAFLVLLFVFLPIVISIPRDIDNGLNYFVSTMAFCGSAFLLATVVSLQHAAKRSGF